MPGLNQPVMHTLGFHYRTGKHEVTASDWDQSLRFADPQEVSGQRSDKGEPQSALRQSPLCAEGGIGSMKAAFTFGSDC